MTDATSRTICSGAAACLLMVSIPSNASPICGYDDSFSDSIPGVLQDVDPASGSLGIPEEYAACDFEPPHTIFWVSLTTGLDYVNGVIYGLEWDGGSGPDIYLYTLATSGCAVGTLVGGSPVGWTNLESLAYNSADGFLYSVDFSFATHTGRLIRIDPQTGLGTPVGGPMAYDIRVMGLAWDSGTNTLYGVTAGHGTRSTEILTIDTQTGGPTIVGATGTPSGSMNSLAIDSTSGPTRLTGAGTTLYQVNATTGAASLIGGTFNGTMWAMGELPALTFADGFESGDVSYWSTSVP